MARVECSFAGRVGLVTCEAIEARERLGEPLAIELAIVSADPIEVRSVLSQPCAVRVEVGPSARTLCGVVTRVSALATARVDDVRRYRVTVRSGLAVLEHRRRSRVFQHLPVPAIVERVLAEGGYPASAVRTALQEEHPPRAYVVQYDESDAAFVRRLCEEEGLYFRFEAGEDEEVVVLEDTSPSAPPALDGPLPVVDESMLSSRSLVAFGCGSARERAPGTVTARGYDHEHPSAALEAVALGGGASERGVEVYATPANGALRDDPARNAARLLESLRAEAATVSFRTTAVALAPGLSVTLACDDGLPGTARPDGKYLVVGLDHRWSRTSDRYALEVRAVPLAVPYRLPKRTPRPRIAGLHTAVVTGPPGEEVHVDDQGRVRVRFPWDREGPSDHGSSLPIRVVQPNMPGSMLLPRVGWEVLVLFEDGDPDRPLVLGRTYNAKQPPPHSLPANKTMTSLATASSPGGKKENALTFDDGAGRQQFAIGAGNDKSLTVGGSMVAQTAKNESHGVSGSQSRSVGASEDVSVGQAYAVAVGSQSASVGGTQRLYVKGNFAVGVGSESVAIGGALLEQVGDPASGAANLAFAAALSGAAAQGAAGGLFAGAVGLAKGAWDGGQQAGTAGAAAGAGMGLAGVAAGMIPGGEAVLSAVQGAGISAPWDENKEAPGGQEGSGGGGTGGGGGGGAVGAPGGGGGYSPAAPPGPGPGHRNTLVSGAMTETIGAIYGVTTPGSIAWTTAGPSTILVGGSHSTTTVKAAATTAGASSELLGSLNVRSKGGIERTVKGVLGTTIAGSLTSTADGAHAIKAGGALSIRIGGSLTLSGSHVTFECGGSKLSASPGGVLIEASVIKVTKASTQTAKTTHT
jgi:type VI secretion system secreted protein VgrG